MLLTRFLPIFSIYFSNFEQIKIVREKHMLDNNLYNLMAQIVEEHRSLYRIKNMYKTDAKKCKECLQFWKKLEADKEDHIQEILGLIQGQFPMEMKKKKYYYSKGEKKASALKKTR